MLSALAAWGFAAVPLAPAVLLLATGLGRFVASGWCPARVA